MKKNQFLVLTLLLTLGAISFTYSAITQRSQPVVPNSRITSNGINNLVQDISALNLAIDAINGGTDAKIGTLTNGKWCTSDGSKVNCNVDAPSGTVNEATVDGYVSNNGYLTTETDPKIGTITESKYCVGVGGKVVCNSDVSGGGSSAWGDLTGVPAGFSDGTDADTIYTHPTTAGNKHVPSGGATDNVLKYSADGTAVWGAEIDPKIGTITNTKYCVGIGSKVECTANAPISKFIDGTTTTDAVFSGGNVGIGTATPTGKLTIDTGNISLTDEYGLGWGGATPTNGIKGNATTNYVAIKTNNTEKMRIIADGKVGIGTATPTAKLTIDTGNISLTDENGLGWGGEIPTNGIKGNATTNYVAIKTNNTEKMRVIADGKVGIGTATPTEALDVVGNVKVSGIIKTTPKSTATCDATTEGGIYYDSDDKTFYGCNGTIWEALNTATPAWACGDTLDYAGETYPTVQIGTQCWLAKNLNVGTMIASPATMPTNNATIEKWCNGSDASGHTTSGDCATYGGLYTWDEMMGYTTTAGAQGICPSGWHIPTDAEWYTLESGLATGACTSTRTAWECDPAGTKLSTATLNGTNSSGFTALLAGYRNTIGLFYSRGSNAYLWSSSESGTTAWKRYLYSANSAVYRNTYDKAYGFSVRCVQD